MPSTLNIRPGPLNFSKVLFSALSKYGWVLILIFNSKMLWAFLMLGEVEKKSWKISSLKIENYFSAQPIQLAYESLVFTISFHIIFLGNIYCFLMFSYIILIDSKRGFSYRFYCCFFFYCSILIYLFFIFN